jgi:hypothetical protein
MNGIAVRSSLEPASVATKSDARWSHVDHLLHPGDDPGQGLVEHRLAPHYYCYRILAHLDPEDAVCGLQTALSLSSD